MVSNETAVKSMQGEHGVLYSGGFSRTVSQFDNNWYGLKGSLYDLDPHTAMLLRSTTECLENAGFDTNPKNRRVPSNWGVFAALPAEASSAASYISQVLNLTGSTVVMSTPSASFSTLNLAYLQLKMRKCEAALVCGARAILNPSQMATGKTTPPGDGCGVLLLMPLNKARKSNRRCLAILKTVFSRSVGATPLIAHETLLAGVLDKAFYEAGLTPEDVSYVEADTVEEQSTEVDAIRQAFKPKVSASVVVGSAKPNIGDLDLVSGIAGLINAVAVLEHAQAPGTPRKVDVPTESVEKPAEDATKTVASKVVQKVKVFPTNMVDLSAAKPGKLISAAVNSFGNLGTNEIAVIQQYSSLPHMAGVATWLVLDADHVIGNRSWLAQEAQKTSSYYPRVFEMLKSKFPIINNALKYLNIACDGTYVKYSFTPKQKTAASFNLTVLKLYYGIVTQLSSLATGVHTIWTTSAMNEITGLLFAGSIDIVAAILFMSGVGIAKKTDNPVAPPVMAEMMSPPKIPVYSCVQGKILSEETFKDESLLNQYIEDLVANLGKARNPKHYQQMLVDRDMSKSVLRITSGEAAATDEDDDVITISFKDLQEVNVLGYLRQKYLKLRSASDKTRINGIKRPSDNVLPCFYDKYPLRKVVEGKMAAVSKGEAENPDVQKPLLEED